MGGGPLKRKLTTAFGRLGGDPRRTQRGTKEGEAGRCRLGSRFGANLGGRFGRSGCYELEGGEIQSG